MNSQDKTQAEVLREATERSKENKGAFEGIMDDINSLGRMFGKWKSGEYSGLSKLNIGLYIAGVLYVLSPLDFIPEMLLSVIGLADDVGVVAFVIFSLRKELKKFKLWELEQSYTEVTEILEE